MSAGPLPGDLTVTTASPGLSAPKRALLAQRLRSNGLGGPSRGRPLSAAQRRLWVLDRLHPGLTAYNVARGLRLTGAIDRAALQAALDQIVARHEVLRTRLRSGDGAPRGEVDPARPVELPCVDLRHLPATERADAAQAALQAEVDRPFDLSRDPLLRGRLLRVGQAEWLLVLTTHHVASDEASRRILFAELAAGYNASVAGREPTVPALPMQYGDWAAWHNARGASAELVADETWWRQRLHRLPVATELPVDRPYTVPLDRGGARLRDVLDADLTARVMDLARSERSTLFQVMLASLAVLLGRYGRIDDVVIGSPVSGRTGETERLIGYFANLLVHRVDTSGDPTFRALLARVRTDMVAALRHADLPFERLVDVVSPERQPGRHPLVQVALSVETDPTDPPALDGLSVASVEVVPSQTKFELALIAAGVEPPGLRLEWEYSTALFDEATIARISAHLRTLLQAVTRTPELPLSAIDVVPAAERAQLTAWGRGPEGPPTAPPTVPDRLAAVAARQPNAVAVTAADGQLTYAELDRAANQLAHELRARGLAAGVLVAVCLERTTRLLVALLGVLRSGAAYVPIDPAFPAERISFMLADADCAVLLTTERLLPHLPATAVPTVLLDRDADQIAERSPTPVAAGPRRRDLAYVIHTSGSTGRPKGVMVPHRALSNLLAAMAIEPGMSADDVLLAVTTLSFDIAALELFLPLWVGGQVVLAGTADAADPDRLAELVAAHRVTVLQATPATWRMLVDSGWSGAPGLTVLCGGEALPPLLAAQLRRRCRVLWNLYGPTETTIWSLAHRIDTAPASIPLGHPIVNTDVVVADAAGAPAPIGVPGELLIAGAGLARGYLGQDALTAERFRRNAATGRRFYHTGDLVRWWSDGGLEFLGRMDSQVKLRGFRIEPGEVEAALRMAPGVAEAAVVLRADTPGDPRLVAYVTLDQPSLPSDLRAALGRRLPAYMVPSAVVVLPQLPRTPAGKIDRSALPSPRTQEDLAGAFEAPASPVEQTLAALWLDVLRVPRVDRRSDFFELGGHSLLMLQLAARVRAEFQVEFPLRTAYEQSSLAEMAELLSDRLFAETGAAELDLLIAQLPGPGQP